MGACLIVTDFFGEYSIWFYAIGWLMLHLHRLWYWRNPEEMIDTLSSDYLITLLEVHDDREFEMTLFSMAGISFKQKVKDVLEHYANCDDRVVSEMAAALLESYKA